MNHLLPGVCQEGSLISSSKYVHVGKAFPNIALTLQVVLFDSRTRAFLISGEVVPCPKFMTLFGV